MQGLGARVNQLLSYLTVNGSFGAIVGDLGDLSQVQGRRYKVKYTDKAPDATWRWAVGLPASWANVSLDSLGRNASVPGIPYQALQDALSVYNNVTVQQQPSLEPVERAMSEPLAEPAGAVGLRRKLASNDTNSSNVTNIIYNRKGKPIGTYGLWEDPKGGGQYAVLKLAGFGILVSLNHSLYI